MRRLATSMNCALIAACLALSGCAGSVSKEDFTTSFADSIKGASPLTPEQASCVGENIYDAAGEERISELDGELSESTTIPKELIAPVAKAGPLCAGAGDVLRKQLAANNITREQVDCIVQAINDDQKMNQQVWEALAASYGGDQSKAEALQETITKTATTCVGG